MLSIPKFIHADGLIPFLELLSVHAETSELELDFSNLHRVSPAGLAALTAFAARRKKKNLITLVSGLDQCPIKTYLERMNLLHHCGWEQGEEDFIRHKEENRFVPLEEIPVNVDGLGDKIAACIAPGGEDGEGPNASLYDTAWYLITEMANNVRQHSRGTGFVAAQTTPSDGFVRIAIADCGHGISGSLKEAGFQWAENLSDEELIEQAMVARVSSKGQPSNEGVGLTLSSRLISLMGGHMLISSGSGIVIRGNSGVTKKQSLAQKTGFPGTLIAISFPRASASDFSLKLHEAKEIEIPLRDTIRSGRFYP